MTSSKVHRMRGEVGVTMKQGMSGSVQGLAVIVMAAGLGKRMKSKLVKVLHPVAGLPMVVHVLELASRLADRGVVVVVGHQGEDVQAAVERQWPGLAGKASGIQIVKQTQQLGTGHAVLQARSVFSKDVHNSPSRYLILNGDTPLLSEQTVRQLLREHEEKKAAVTLLTAVMEDASGYGRVIRTGGAAYQSPGDGVACKIVEDKDASDTERLVREINVGTYVVDGEFLFPALERLDPRNAQGEYYLTDIVSMAVERNCPVAAWRLSGAEEGLGVNTRGQLAEAERVIRQRIRERWLDEGVTMRDPASTWIDAGVTIGRDTVLYPQVTLEGTTTVGEDAVIHAGVRITDCRIGNRVTILDHCVLKDSSIEDEAAVGPFVHLRPGVVLRKKSKVGNFVEMKKAELGEGAKANHLSYLGDARLGKGVNVGAGTITCNFDGWKKYETVIGDDVFVGSDTQLIAPVTVGRGAVIAAGSTITQDVPSDALAITRAAQVNRPGWAIRRRALQQEATQAESDTKKGESVVKAKTPKARSTQRAKRR
jgi:bifunctional UDP-N-acetylglucosamine pyrophosphorylase/glucosamine-1-phosphate N-acetyltransferase